MSLRSRLVTLVVAFIVAGIAFAGPAFAHTGFESSDPADGAVLDGPVDTVTLVFTGEAAPTGEGFEVLAADGSVRQPIEADTADGLTWVLRFDPPLEGGATGMRWSVKAPDAHPINGSFSFTAGGSSPVTASSGAGGLDDFLTEGTDATGASRLSSFARMLSLTGAMLGVGALAFAALVLRGDERDIRRVMFWVRRSGLVIAIGAIINLVARIGIDSGGDWSAVTSPSAVASAWWSTAALASVLRLVGGIGLFAGTHPVVTGASVTPDLVARVRELVGAGVTVTHAAQSDAPHLGTIDRDALRTDSPPEDMAWVPNGASAGALGGAALLVASFAFDGHTISKGNWFVHSMFDAVHVTAAAIWLGGVAMLAAVMWRRHRSGDAVRPLNLAVRFSVVATVALVAVGFAGVALAVIILDGPGELLSTPWGRLLLVKTSLVAVAAGAGGYNHSVLIPQMQLHPDDDELTTHFRRVVSGEVALLVAIVFVTAWLVGAAS